MKKVNKHTRAGKNGRVISCPDCGEKRRVYHFAWCGITCSTCEKIVDKERWEL